MPSALDEGRAMLAHQMRGLTEKPGGQGRFQPGQSGNPGGRPRCSEELRKLARSYTEQSLSVIASVLLDDKARHADRLTAAELLLCRGHGRPAVEVTERDQLTDLLAIVGLLLKLEQGRVMVRLKAVPPERLQRMTPAELIALFASAEQDSDVPALPPPENP